MCGRYTLFGPWAEIHKLYDLTNSVDRGRNVPARHNIAPTQEVLFVAAPDGRHELKEGRWWLVPFWAKELNSKYPMFNARSEDAHAKPAFKHSYSSKRCLIPANGYYEWKKAEDGGKDPHFIHLPNAQPFSFAGLWARNETLDITSCTILTAPAVSEISHLHGRMPIILKEDQHDAWLSPEVPVDEAISLLTENRDHELISYRVGREVNSSSAKGEGLVTPLS